MRQSRDARIAEKCRIARGFLLSNTRHRFVTIDGWNMELGVTMLDPRTRSAVLELLHEIEAIANRTEPKP